MNTSTAELLNTPTIPGNKQFDVCIIGAGIAGASLACFLAQKNIQIALIEKEWTAPDRIVGELLQPDGLKQLKEMNLVHLVDNIDAQKINGYAIFLNGEHIKVDYPSVNGEQAFGYGLKNQRLLQNLRNEVLTHPSITVINGTVDEMIYDGDKIVGAKITLPNGETDFAKAPLTVVSDGFFSKLRKNLHNQNAEVTGYFLGMILENTELLHPGYGHVFVGHNAKFLAYPTTANEIRLLIERKDVKWGIKSPELKAWLYENIMPQLPESMHKSFSEAVEQADFKVMPNHLLPANPRKIDGVIMLGDSLNMRNPLTGGGMTVALTDVKNLGFLLSNNKEAFVNKELSKIIDKFYNLHKCNATINILADALQRVFSDSHLAQACFDYLKKGDNAVEPIGLLAGLNRNQSTLLQHFFAVALDGAGNQIKENGLKDGYKNAKEMMMNATKIVSPLVLNENQGTITRSLIQFAKKITN
jgi:squalene monooxygenase